MEKGGTLGRKEKRDMGEEKYKLGEEKWGKYRPTWTTHDKCFILNIAWLSMSGNV